MSNFGWGDPSQWGTPTPPQQTPTLEQALANYQNAQVPAPQVPGNVGAAAAPATGGWRNLTPQQQMFLMQMMHGGGAQAQNPLMGRGFNAGQMTPQQLMLLQQLLQQRQQAAGIGAAGIGNAQQLANMPAAPQPIAAQQQPGYMPAPNPYGVQ